MVTQCQISLISWIPNIWVVAVEVLAVAYGLTQLSSFWRKNCQNFQRHSRSHLMMQLNYPYIWLSKYCLIVKYGLTWLILLGVTSNDSGELTTYDFQFLVYNSNNSYSSNIWPNSAPLRNMRHQNYATVNLTLSFNITRVKSSGAFRLFVYDFQYVFNSNHMSILHRLPVRAVKNFPLLLLCHLDILNPSNPSPTLTLGLLFLKI